MLDITLPEKLSSKQYLDTSRYFRLLFLRYYNILLTLISYKGLSKQQSLTLERYLRTNGIAYLASYDNGNTLSVEENRPNEKLFSEISYNPLLEKYEGDYVTITNKNDFYNLNTLKVFESDFNILAYYCELLAHIEKSRKAIINTSKFNTFIISEFADESVDSLKLISALENDEPFINISKMVNIKDSLYNLNGTQNLSGLATLKDEFNVRLSEMREYFGIKDIAIDKKSGINYQETEANQVTVDINQNLYLQPRNAKLQLFNKRFNTNLRADFYHETLDSESEKEKLDNETE